MEFVELLHVRQSLLLVVLGAPVPNQSLPVARGRGASCVGNVDARELVHLAIGSLPPSTFPGQPRDPRATRTHAGGELRGRLMATQRLRVSQHGRGQPDMAAAHGNLSTRASRRHLFTGWHHYIGGNVQLVSVNTQVKRRRKPY